MTSSSAPSTTVFLVEDNDIVRRAVSALIAATPDLEVVGEAATARVALDLIPRIGPDVAVLDVNLPDGDGITLCRQLHVSQRGVRCLMLTAHSTPEEVQAAFRAGARGFLIKNLRGIGLLDAIRDVAAGLVVIDPAASPPAGPDLTESA